jgi:hypothetical protein
LVSGTFHAKKTIAATPNRAYSQNVFGCASAQREDLGDHHPEDRAKADLEARDVEHHGRQRDPGVGVVERRAHVERSPL